MNTHDPARQPLMEVVTSSDSGGSDDEPPDGIDTSPVNSEAPATPVGRNPIANIDANKVAPAVCVLTRTRTAGNRTTGIMRAIHAVRDHLNEHVLDIYGRSIDGRHIHRHHPRVCVHRQTHYDECSCERACACMSGVSCRPHVRTIRHSSTNNARTQTPPT